MLATWKRHCVNFQVGVPMEMQLSIYGIAHFSKFLWASIIFRRTSRFLALFSSYSFFKHFRISRSISLQWPKNLRTLCSLWHFLSRLIMRLHSSVCRWGDRSGCIFRSEDFSSKTIWENFHLLGQLLSLPPASFSSWPPYGRNPTSFPNEVPFFFSQNLPWIWTNQLQAARGSSTTLQKHTWPQPAQLLLIKNPVLLRRTDQKSAYRKRLSR